MVNDLASYLGVDPGLVLDQFKKAAASRRAPVPQAAARQCDSGDGADPAERAAFERSRARRNAARLLPALTDTFVTREVFEGLRQAAGAGAGFSYSRSGGPFTGAREGTIA